MCLPLQWLFDSAELQATPRTDPDQPAAGEVEQPPELPNIAFPAFSDHDEPAVKAQRMSTHVPPKAGTSHSNVSACQVDGCTETDANGPFRWKRCRICNYHANAPSLMHRGQLQRFCQLCKRLHPIDRFDGANKSCSAKLAEHSRRRRERNRERNKCKNGAGNANSSSSRKVQSEHASVHQQQQAQVKQPAKHEHHQKELFDLVEHEQQQHQQRPSKQQQQPCCSSSDTENTAPNKANDNHACEQVKLEPQLSVTAEYNMDETNASNALKPPALLQLPSNLSLLSGVAGGKSEHKLQSQDETHPDETQHVSTRIGSKGEAEHQSASDDSNEAVSKLEPAPTNAANGIECPDRHQRAVFKLYGRTPEVRCYASHSSNSSFAYDPSSLILNLFMDDSPQHNSAFHQT